MQDRLLNIRREMKKIHDLGYTRARYPAQAGDIGLVANLRGSDEVLKSDRQGRISPAVASTL